MARRDPGAWKAKHLVLFVVIALLVTIAVSSMNWAVGSKHSQDSKSSMDLETVLAGLDGSSILPGSLDPSNTISARPLSFVFDPDGLFVSDARTAGLTIPFDERAFLASQDWDLPDAHGVYVLSVSHQLFCIDFIGNALLREAPGSGWQRQDSGSDDIFHHCIEYLTQTTICAADLALERATIHVDPGPEHKWRPSGVLTNSSTHQCRDRPDIIAPILDVIIHNTTLMQPGYWLYAPHYESKVSALPGFLNNSQLQQGPYIYDTDGELAWSGTHLHEWSFVNDFKYHPWGEFSLLEGGTLRTSSPRGAEPMFLGPSLQRVSRMRMPSSVEKVNPHDLQLSNSGDTIVVEKSIAGPKPQDGGFQMIEDHVFEIDRHTGDVLFSWNSSEHIPTPKPRVVDLEGFAQIVEMHFLRVNSVDRTSSGDYLISGRGTNTIYLISGVDGAVLWRLGGKDSPSSDFELQNFTFSAQHDARMLHLNNSGVTTISFLDNASDGYETSETTSAGFVVALNHKDKTASLLSRMSRPDGGISDRRGNVQALPDKGFSICWSQHGWVTEFDRDGRNVVEARFRDDNLYTYRAFKVLEADLKAIASAELPAVIAFKLQSDEHRGGDAFSFTTYVSWNGGFGVSSWRVFGCIAMPSPGSTGDSQGLSDCEGHWSSLTSALRQEFETQLHHTSETAIAWVYVEGLDGSGKSLAQSEPTAIRSLEIEGGPTPVQEHQQAMPLISSAIQDGKSQDGKSTILTSQATASIQAESPQYRIHGLYVLSKTPDPRFVSWITWLLVLWCTVMAITSIICLICCQFHGKVARESTRS
ncbi:hypothetical protein M409DRAFT_20688 [Zasmidium cellare ATCC 36951]|uniref:ASST-domain-containing protein n=1 Tax=Zasmidium cellare ATCC 36951 TaxID=1080233 RepID=A0A6A6CQN7_ZASCE|nr:uncharacterized protein M409DRAFT_20688 [Zasmidium cellare ATCC 36951]KAF2169474.1 hypothetical protein M409DRAFT_20688 [Zasmidium cellare ATCC 36951]